MPTSAASAPAASGAAARRRQAGPRRAGGKRGRGAPGKTPFVAAVETTPEGKPVRLKLRRVTGFCNRALSGFAKRSLDPDCEVVSDGLVCFAAVPDPGGRREGIETRSGPRRCPAGCSDWLRFPRKQDSVWRE